MPPNRVDKLRSSGAFPLNGVGSGLKGGIRPFAEPRRSGSGAGCWVVVLAAASCAIMFAMKGVFSTGGWTAGWKPWAWDSLLVWLESAR